MPTLLHFNRFSYDGYDLISEAVDVKGELSLQVKQSCWVVRLYQHGALSG